jgi:ribosomal protein L16 Arg81 hydroxylase
VPTKVLDVLHMARLNEQPTETYTRIGIPVERLGETYLRLPGAPDRFTELFSWTKLNDILDHHRFEPGRLRLVQKGDELSADEYISTIHFRGRSKPLLRSHDLTRLFRAGATVVVDYIDEAHEPVRALAEYLEDALRSHVSVNAYAGVAASPGFEVHYDDHDVIVLQIAGRKHWKVFGANARYPLQPGTERAQNAPTVPEWEGTLEQGDALYLPRGCWHAAMALGEPTLHLTVGLYRPTGIDLLMWLCTGAPSSELYRRDLPMTESGGTRTRHIEALAATLAAAWSGGDVAERFYTETMSASRPRFNLP